MKYINASAIMALLTLEAGLISASLDARQVPIAKWTLEGYSNFGTPYPSYNVSVPEDGVVYPITNPIIVFFIADANSINTYSTNTGFFTPTSRCIFTLEDFTAVSIDVALEINPQKVIGVSCVPLPSTSSASSSGFAYYSSVATYGYPSATGAYTVSSVPAPYPTATGVYSAVGPSTTGTGVTPGGQSNVPFTGDAGRVGAGFGGLIGALIGAGFLL